MYNIDDTIDDDEAAPLPWFAMPGSDDAAVLAWLDAAEKAEAELAAGLAENLDACIELFAELRTLVRQHHRAARVI
jgi:hypothetical protein